MTNRGPFSPNSPPETLTRTADLPVLGTFPGGPSRPLGAFLKRNVWPWVCDIIGVLCIFFMLFASLFVGGLSQ